MAGDFIVVIEGIKGETAVDKFKDKGGIDVLSFSWGVSNSGSFALQGGGGSGRADFQDLSFMKMVDKASPLLAKACAEGTHIGAASLHVRKAGGEQVEYYTIELKDVLVSSYQPSASGQDVSEAFSLNYAKIKFDYLPQDEKGKLGGAINFTYDLKARKA